MNEINRTEDKQNHKTKKLNVNDKPMGFLETPELQSQRYHRLKNTEEREIGEIKKQVGGFQQNFTKLEKPRQT